MVRRIILSAIAALCIGSIASAAEIKPIDLKPYVGYSPFDNIKADWLIPRGDHVFGGVPWKIDGVILLYGKNAAQKTNAARTLVDIPVGQTFEKLHLLAAAQQTSPDATVIAKVHFHYTDDTTGTIDIRFGDHVRHYMGDWHKKEKSTKDKTVHQAWHGQFEPVSNHDQYLRLYHIPLANPSPGKEVRSISFESTKQAAALMVAAMSVGPADAEKLPSEVLGKGKFPDLRKRDGTLETGEGYVYSNQGEPISKALVKIIAARNYESGELNENPPVVQATTDAQGHFTLNDLPDDCAYRLLIIAEAFAPYVYHGLDAKSDPIRMRLERATNQLSAFTARARVVGPDQKPVAFAQIEHDGVAYENGTTWGGAMGLPDYALTDTNGEFAFSGPKQFDRLQVKISAPGLAPFKDWIAVTNTATVIQLDIGATIKGRVLDMKGEPVPNARLGISGADRNSEVFAGAFFTKTRPDGTFVFEHVAPHIKWNLFGTIESFKTFGALASRSTLSGAHRETNDLGNLQVTSALTLSGLVKTKHGEPMPKGLKLQISIESAWDSQSADIATNGHFSFTGLYPGRIEMYLRSETWRLSPLNRSTSPWNNWEMTGMVEKDKDDLVIQIEKGKRDYVYENNNGSLPSVDEPQLKEIAGIENLEGTAIVISGAVLDDKTGTPISDCKIVPGYKSTAAAWGYATGVPQKNLVQKLLKPLQKKQTSWWEKPFWMPSRAEQTTNGGFSIAFVRLQSSPVLRVEAKGYEPVITEPMPFSTNIVIRLSIGNGPSGTVLTPDRKPAENADVLYSAGGEQHGLHGRQLNVYDDGSKYLKKTGADGRFAFNARSEGQLLYVTHETGYAEVPVHEKDLKVDVQLKAWASLSGTLTFSNGTPASGVQLELTLYDGSNWDSSQPLLHYNHKIKTDSRGYFLFTNVPPRRVQVQRIVPSGRNSWSSVLQTWTDVEPGITNNLGKIIYDTPPAKSVMEQLKEKLNLQ